MSKDRPKGGRTILSRTVAEAWGKSILLAILVLKSKLSCTIIHNQLTNLQLLTKSVPKSFAANQNKKQVTKLQLLTNKRN